MSNKSPHTASETDPAPCPRCDGPITGPHEYRDNQGEPSPCPWVEDGKRPRSGPTWLLDPLLYVEAGHDSDGNRLVYLPCLFCGESYRYGHRFKGSQGEPIPCPGEGYKHSGGVGGHLLAQVPHPKEADR